MKNFKPGSAVLTNYEAVRKRARAAATRWWNEIFLSQDLPHLITTKWLNLINPVRSAGNKNALCRNHKVVE
jgi:hypothetical protein